MWWRRALSGSGAVTSAYLRRRSLSSSSSSSSSNAIDSIILRSLKDHYLEVSKMSPPPKVSPPEHYTILKGALDHDGPVLQRTYKDTEEISLSVMRLDNLIPSGEEVTEDNYHDSINQLLLHVEVSKQGREESLHFLCGLYSDAIGIHSVCLRPKVGKEIGETITPETASKFQGRIFQELDQKVRDAFHLFIEARGVTEGLFPFLQAWLYVKDHRNLSKWFKNVGTFISEKKSESEK